ncbi:hypothetical protein ACJX0J_004834, partial (mitochondrion) [Zea mays]
YQKDFPISYGPVVSLPWYVASVLELPDWPMILRVQHFVWIQPLLHLEIRAWNFNLSYLIEYIKMCIAYFNPHTLL